MTKSKKLLDLIFSHRAKRVWSFLFVFFAVAFLFLPTLPALAQDMNQGLGQFANETGLPATPLPALIGRIVRIFIGFLGLIAVVIVLYGGFIWMTSGGDSDKIDKAKKLMRAGLIGLLIIVLAYALATFVIYLIGRIVGPGGPGGGCTIGQVNGCYRCEGPEPGHWVYHQEWPGCGFPPDAFSINKILTTHGQGDNHGPDVYLCSAVGPMFNHWVDGTVIQQLAQANRLKIVDEQNNIFSGTWESRSNMSIFKHPDLFLPNTVYRAFLPKEIADTNGKLLQNCQADGGCPFDRENQIYIWTFTTGTNTDTTKPYITSTYPIFDKTDPTYPDRNVSRKPILEVNFSESIDPTTVIDKDNNLIADNVWLAEIDKQDGQIINKFLSSELTAEINQRGDGFVFYLRGDKLLDPFAWYRIHVGNVADLCSNAMDPAVEWELQTNDRAPGVESYYPTGTQACPNTNIAIIFNTSMYENDVKLEVVQGGQIILSGEMKPSEIGSPYSINGLGGRFYVVDNNDNPIDNHFRVFTFDPTTDLSNNTPYQVKVATDLVINTQGDTLKQNWIFTTATPQTCLCAPFITYINPNSGSRGQCVTVNGECFTGTPAQPAQPKDNQIQFFFSGSPTSTDIFAYNANSLTTIVPISTDPDIRPKAELTIKYGPPNNSELTSNQSEFYINQPGEANGPCLWSIRPDSGYAGETKVTLNGIRFGTGNPATDGVFFYNQQKVKDCPAGPFGKCEWTNTKISNAMVPGTAQSGNVVVVNDRGTSNGVPFTVLTHGGAAGDPCYYENVCSVGVKQCQNPANYFCLVNEIDCRCCCRPDPNSCQDDLTCMANQGTCSGDSRGLCCGCTSDDQCGTGSGCGILDPNRCCYPNPIIESKDPDNGAVGVCKNTSVQVIFNQVMDPGSLSLSNINLAQCDNQNCDNATSTPATIIVDQYKDPDKTGFTLYPRGCLLQPNTWYQTTVKGKQPSGKMGEGVRSAKGVSMLGTVKWVFQTGDSLCVVDRVVINPTTATIVVEQTQHYSATASASSTPVCVPSFDWSSSKTLIATVTPLAGLETTADGKSKGQTIISGGVWVENLIGRRFVKGDSTLNVRLTNLAVVDDSACDPIHQQYPSPNPRPNDQQVCQNIQISARFNKNVDDNSVTSTTIQVFKITKDGQIPVEASSITVQAYSTSTEEFIFTPKDILEEDTTYRVVVKGGDNGVLGEDDSTMANDYTWQFKTMSGQTCPPQAVGVIPPLYSVYQIKDENGKNTKVGYTSSALGARCQMLTGNFSWQWSSTVPRVASVDQVSGPNTTSTALAIGDTNITATTNNISNFGHLIVSPPPTITTETPAPTSTNVCLNALISAQFDQVMAHSTLNTTSTALWEWIPGVPSSFKPDSWVKNLADKIQHLLLNIVKAQNINLVPHWELVSGQVINYDTGPTSTPITVTEFIPDHVLDPNTLFKVQISQSVKSKYGVNMVNDKVWQFTTGAQICHINSVKVDPSPFVFTKSAQTQDFTATVYAINHQPIIPIPGVYTWTWQWSALPANLVTVSGDQNNPSTGLVTAGNKNGSTTLRAETTDSNNRQAFASAAIEIFLCENPWVYDNSFYNFELLYCRDGNPLLPDIGTPKEVLPPGSNSKLHLLFSVPNTSDLVGLMVYDNFDHLTPSEWYPANVSNPGSPVTLSIDGYRALRDGRTVYVNAANVDFGQGMIKKNTPDLYSNIFLISYNDNAAPETLNIAGQLVQNWKFNTNVRDNKDKLVRDLERIYHFNQISAMLYKYHQANRLYPDLESGSYIKSMSASRWPSWQQTLAQALGASLPIDPLNTFGPQAQQSPPLSCASCPSNDPQCSGTCYNPDPSQKRYECIAGSHIYQYNYQSSARNYSLYSNLEYGQPSYWQQNCGAHDTAALCAQHNWCLWSNNQCQAKTLNYGQNPCSSPSACACFNMRYQPAAVLGGQQGQNEWAK